MLEKKKMIKRDIVSSLAYLILGLFWIYTGATSMLASKTGNRAIMIIGALLVTLSLWGVRKYYLAKKA